MKSVAGLIFGAAVVFAEEGLKDGEVDGVKGGDTEGEKQFFGSGFRRFYIRPFPLPTNHYPSGTTVANVRTYFFFRPFCSSMCLVLLLSGLQRSCDC